MSQKRIKLSGAQFRKRRKVEEEKKERYRGKNHLDCGKSLMFIFVDMNC